MSGDQTRDARRAVLAGAIGTTIEWYDFFIYGTAAALVFGPQFFPQESEFAETLAAFATFAIGFIARPVGGIVMGHFGDRVGRKSMLVWSLMLMGFATVAIGLLPNYDSIGIVAPVLLVLLRFMQGFALGGEWGGAVLMAVEHAPDGRRGLYGSFVALGLPAGIMLSNVVFLVASSSVNSAAFAAWGWRVPFLASSVLIVVGVFVRIGLSESPAFGVAMRAQAARRLPVVEVLRHNWRTVLLAAGSYVGISVQGYIVSVYFVSYSTRELGLHLTTILGLMLVVSAVNAGSIVAFARWSDRYGRHRTMTWGCAGLVIWSLFFFPLVDTKSLSLIAFSLCGLWFLVGAYTGPQPAVFSELFPVDIRYSGMSLSLNLGTILGGALAPAIASTLFNATGDSRAITVYLTAMSILSWLSTRMLEKVHRSARPNPIPSTSRSNVEVAAER